MTDFKKIQSYYSIFNEENRLKSDYSGKLEYEMTLRKIQNFLPDSATILDLGGAAGVYTFPLAKLGYKMYLADLSETLIAKAEEKTRILNESNIISCDVVNAIDLGIYETGQFDVVLLFGPLYHLLEESERHQCINEVYRVLKKGGLVFASFIPYLSGSIAIVDRYFRHPEQVDQNTLKEVFQTGRFTNKDSCGFQEGYYPSSTEVEQLFHSHLFIKQSVSSIRSFGYGREEQIYRVNNRDMFDEIFFLLEQTSEIKEIVETCGHAMYVGRKGI